MQKTTRNKKTVSTGRGSVVLIIVLLCGSASLRLFSSATAVLAAEEIEVQTEEPQTVQDEPGQGMDVQGIDRLLKTLLARESDVEKREDDVLARENKVEMAKKQLEQQLIALETAEEQLRATIALANSAAEDDLSKLTSVYENMKPKVAAELFEEMDADFAAGFLARMKPDSAASIMTGLTPQKAYSISVVLAGRNADVPTQ